MPTYEYECAKCGKQFECFQSMNDAPLKVCTAELCRLKRWGRGRVKRLLGTGAGLLFKGSGFYITDYRSEGYRQAASKEGGAAAAGKESKPAASPAGDGGAKPAASGGSGKEKKK